MKRKGTIALAMKRREEQDRTPQVPIMLYSQIDKLKKIADYYSRVHDNENHDRIDRLLTNIENKLRQINDYQNSMRGAIPLHRAAGYDKMVEGIIKYSRQAEIIDPPARMVIDNLETTLKQRTLEVYSDGGIPETDSHCISLRSRILELQAQIGR